MMVLPHYEAPATDRTPIIGATWETGDDNWEINHDANWIEIGIESGTVGVRFIWIVLNNMIL